MPLTIQYALVQSNDIDKSCQEVAEVYMPNVNKLKKYKFKINEKNLDMDMEDIVVNLAENHIDKLSDDKANTKNVGYFTLNDLDNRIAVNVRDMDRIWEEIFTVIDKGTGEKEVVKDNKESGIKYAEYRAEETGNNYEIHIKKVDRYNTSLEAEVGPSIEDNRKDKIFVIFWFVDTDFGGGFDFLGGNDYNNLNNFY